MADYIPTSAQDVIQSFEASFQDKREIPEALEMEWLNKAVGRYSVELEPLEYDDELGEFSTKLDRYIIDTLAAFMKQSYQERELSKVNKRVSIVGKDISINSGGHLSTAARNELLYDESKSSEMIANQKATAYV
jgi:hypothetical protein